MVAALAGDSTTTRVPLPAVRFLADDFTTGFLVLAGLALALAATLESCLTFLLAATSNHLILVARDPAKPAIQFGLDQRRHDRRQGQADLSAEQGRGGCSRA